MKIDRKLIFNKYGGKCAYCGCELEFKKMQIDHILAKRRDLKDVMNGPDTIDNYNPSCKSCNSGKNTFTINQYREWIEDQYGRCIRDSATFRSLVRFGIVKKHKNNVTFYFETL